MKLRYPAVAGSWYAGTPQDLRKQIEQLFEEFWQKIYLADVIVMPQCNYLSHPKTFDAFKMFDKEVVVPDCGHVVFQKTGVLGKTEENSGGLGTDIIKEAKLRNISNHPDLNHIERFISDNGITDDHYNYLITDYPRDRNTKADIIRIIR